MALKTFEFKAALLAFSVQISSVEAKYLGFCTLMKH
jgi:hypothetical protein